MPENFSVPKYFPNSCPLPRFNWPPSRVQQAAFGRQKSAFGGALFAWRQGREGPVAALCQRSSVRGSVPFAQLLSAATGLSGPTSATRPLGQETGGCRRKPKTTSHVLVENTQISTASRDQSITVGTSRLVRMVPRLTRDSTFFVGGIGMMRAKLLSQPQTRAKLIRGLDDSHIRSSISDIPGHQHGILASREDLKSRLIASYLPPMMKIEGLAWLTNVKRLVFNASQNSASEPDSSSTHDGGLFSRPSKARSGGLSIATVAAGLNGDIRDCFS